MSAQSAQEIEKGLGRLKIPGRECQADRALPIRNLDYQDRNTMPGRWLRVIGRLCASSHNEVARASQTPVGWGRRRLKIRMVFVAPKSPTDHARCLRSN